MKFTLSIPKKNNPLALAICFALFFIGTIYLLLYAASDFERMSYVEADQTIYMQYARNMAEGHPYVFTLGDAPSTGSTSHLYPWILAGLYKLGAHGNSFFAAIFWLNAFLYMGMIFSVWLIAKKMAPKLAPFAVFLTVLSGQTLTTFFGGTDMGLFSFLALTLFASLLYEKKKTAMLLAALCGLTRPEGFVFAIVALFIGCFLFIFNRKKRRENNNIVLETSSLFFLTGITGLIAFFFVLIINYRMTGYFQFMSVINKGYFMQYSFFGAILRTLYDFMEMISGIIFGLNGERRQFLGIPILSGLLGVFGALLLTRNKKLALREWWFLLITGATFLTISMSGFQGISNDRYLGWFFPIWGIYILLGAKKLSSFFHSKFVFNALVCLLFGFQLISICIAFDYLYSSGIQSTQQKQFSSKIADLLPKNSSIGIVEGAGIQYFLPDYKIRNIAGILSPSLFVPYTSSPLQQVILEHLKHNVESRPQYFIFRVNKRKSFFNALPSVREDLLLSDVRGSLTTGIDFGLYKTNFEGLNGGEDPMLVSSKKKCIDRLDLGYQKDEKGHAYNYQSYFSGIKTFLLSKTTVLGKKKEYFEAGYLITGSESFVIQNVKKKMDLLLVLRTSRTIKVASLVTIQKVVTHYAFNNKIKLLISVDGDKPTPVDLELNEKGFSEVKISVAENRIHSTHPRITIYGDHISFAYWFYQ